MGSRPTRKYLRSLAVLSLAAIAAIATVGVVGAGPIIPDPITDEADDIATLFWIVTAMGLAVFVLVTAALLVAIFRFRRKSHDELPAQTHGSTVLEMVWIGIPVVIVLILFGASFVVLQEIEEDAEPEDLTVQVRGFQFSWQFTYDLEDLGTGDAVDGGENFSIIGTGIEQPELVIPVDEPVEFVLNSQDVIHSFYVRDFLYKLDVIPGHENSFTVTPHTTGTFQAQCAELCGIDHALMRFQLTVVERDEFDAWVLEQSGATTAAKAIQ